MDYSKTEELPMNKFLVLFYVLFPYNCSDFEQVGFYRDGSNKLDNNIHKVKS